MDKFCARCDVVILSGQKSCPLCHDTTDAENKYPPLQRNLLSKRGEVLYLYYPQYTTHRRYPARLTKKIVAFASMMAVTICILINLLIPPFGWSMIVTASIAVSWLIFDIDSFRRSWLMAIVRSSLAGMFVIFIIDMLDLQASWSVAWVLPWTFLGLTILLTVFIVIQPLRMYGLYDSVVYLLLMTAVSLVLMVCGFAGLFVPAWPAAISAVYQLMTMAWLAIFGNRSMRGELVKRLHF